METDTRLIPRVGIAALSSPLEVGADRAPAIAGELAERLAGAGCVVIQLGAVSSPAEAVAAGERLARERVDAVVLAMACWCEDYLAVDMLEECAVPVLLWPIPGMETGALCGTQQLTCYLKELRHPYAAVFGQTDDSACMTSALAFLRAAALHSRLRRCRIGMAGQHINGMTHPAPNEFALKRVLGPRIVWLDVPGLLREAETRPPEDAQSLWSSVRERSGSCHVGDAEGTDAMQVYAALRAAVSLHGLSCLSVGCYPDLMGRVCLAASLLADEGIPLACEGDAHGALGQYILQLLTAQPTHNTDWLDPVDDESVVFTHCGSGSFGLAEKPEEVRLDSVRLMGQGVCALFTAKPGPVTMVNFTPSRAGYQCALVEAEAVPTDMVFPGNPVRVRFRQAVKDLIPWIHEEGIGHHWMIGYGHVAAELRAWARLAGPDLRLLEP